jgi:hypothetical protein
MVALCPTHHRHYGKVRREEAYNIKANPFNVSEGKINGVLGTDRSQIALVAGTNYFVNCDSVLSYCGINIISCRISEGQAKVSLYIPNDDFWPEVRIEDNEFVAGTSSFWDIEFKTNYLLFRRKAGEKFVEIDLRKQLVSITADLQVNGTRLTLTNSGMALGNRKPIFHSYHGYYQDLQTIYAVDPPKGYKFVAPNYAMGQPRSQLIHTGRDEAVGFAVYSLQL